MSSFSFPPLDYVGLAVSLVLTFWSWTRRVQKLPLPPSPRVYPLIGNLLVCELHDNLELSILRQPGHAECLYRAGACEDREGFE